MAMTRICDECGQPIDETTAFYTAQVQTLQQVEGVLTTSDSQQMDWHADHLPGQMTQDAVADG